MSTPFYVPPEQLYQERAEYARKGISRGKPIVALEFDNGRLSSAKASVIRHRCFTLVSMLATKHLEILRKKVREMRPI